MCAGTLGETLTVGYARRGHLRKAKRSTAFTPTNSTRVSICTASRVLCACTTGPWGVERSWSTIDTRTTLWWNSNLKAGGGDVGAD